MTADERISVLESAVFLLLMNADFRPQLAIVEQVERADLVSAALKRLRDHGWRDRFDKGTCEDVLFELFEEQDTEGVGR